MIYERLVITSKNSSKIGQCRCTAVVQLHLASHYFENWSAAPSSEQTCHCCARRRRAARGRRNGSPSPSPTSWRARRRERGRECVCVFFCDKGAANTEIYILTIHDALQISEGLQGRVCRVGSMRSQPAAGGRSATRDPPKRCGSHHSYL